ncbi:autophagy protein 13 [Vanrija albida]|uniref:Autophagy-related protein 13 n=1 Tax=Vanrija albida TaxID=181172 RepID=A0ABR3Q5P7_9TREE
MAAAAPGAAATGGADSPQRGGSSSPASASASVVAAAPNADATSSASSSQIAPGGVSRADQIVYRFYLKTVSVLVDGRVSHLRNAAERKKDRWFNLTIPDTDVHKRDLAIYRTVSTSHPPHPSPDTAAGESRSTVPPLLISLILDTNDIPPGQTLLWNREGQRVALDPTLVRPAAQPQRRPGIVLERWTFRATDVAVDPAAGASDMAPPTAYRLGIIHFRALYSFIRLLPAYRLFRRLKRANSGLRLGIKLWAAEGYANSPAEIAEAWEVMDRDLIGIDVPLERMIPGAEVDPAPGSSLERYDFPPVDLFGSTYELGVVYRSNVDFDVEDMESVLSERFVDMDEEWFTPTVARHRLESEARVAASAGTSRSASRAGVTPPTVAGRVTVPPTGAAGLGSGSSGSRQVSSRAASGSAGTQPSSLGAAKWGALAEGLPFASASQVAEAPPSPVPSGVPYRRLSAHSLQPFRSISASPSTSILRTAPANPAQAPASSTPQSARAIPGQTSSPMARTSSFLSQSGRSFTHAQVANMQGVSPVGGAPPFALQPSGVSPPLSQLPSSLSFSKQAVGRGPAGVTFPMASPFLPSSLDRDSPGASQLATKRHSSSLSGRRAFPGSSPGDSALPPGLSLRRTSTKESGLRHSSIDGGPDGADNDDVHAFLRALDSWSAPTSIQGHGQSPKVSTSALGSSGAPTFTTTAPTPRRTSAASSSLISPLSATASAPDAGSATRTPLTKAHVGDVLSRMKGSMRESSVDSPPHATPPPMSRDSSVSERARQHSGLGTPGGPSPRTSTPASQMARRASGITDSGTPGSSVPRQSTLLSGQRPLASSPLSGGGGAAMRHAASGTSLPRPAALQAVDQGHARSLPGNPAVSTSPQPMTRIQPASVLSPQTTGGTTVGTSVGRRAAGPVLVRGGFGAPSLSSKASTSSSSPSHSPVRDYRYRSGLQAERERLDDDSGSTSTSTGYTFPRRLASNALVSGFTLAGAAPQHPAGSGNGPGGGVRRTAPSSLGAFDIEHEDGALRGAGRGRVASEGSGSPAGQFPTPLSPVVDGLMARLALVQQGEPATTTTTHEEERVPEPPAP